ncbi:MAG: alpha/beta hydrolase [Clostridia bacterium]|nr:alpha/beta hydrolase [Clostridia bacterium]
MNAKKWVCIALALVLIGSVVACIAHTSGGAVAIRSIEYVTEDGILLRALLYVPNSATNTDPAPAIVSSHGFNNTAEVQNMNAVELSKRGYVVMAIDAYSHGRSGINSVNMDHDGLVPDMGGYAALQYVDRLPFVDSTRIGMVGHSMGCGVIQNAALRAFTAQESDPSIATPTALLLTSNAYSTDADVKELILAKYPVNVGVVYGQFDEWAENMWITVKKGSDINITPKAIAGMGFSGAKYGAYYDFGVNAELSAQQAVEVAANKTLRVIYQPPIDHPMVHFSSIAEESILEFFNVTLKAGTEPLPATSQTWYWKEIGTGLALLGFFIFLAPFALMLLKLPFFTGIVKPEPLSPTVVDDRKGKLIYWLIYIVCLLPAPLLFYWAVGYPIDIPNMGRTIPIVLTANPYFQLPTVNGMVVMNLIVGAFLLAVFILTYQFIMKKNGSTINNLGIKISVKNFFKSLLLAVIVFLSGYTLLVLADYFFLTDFRLWVFSIRPLTVMKLGIFLKYLPFFAFFFIVTSLTLNSFTRMRGQKEWLNVILLIGASICGFAVLTLLDYGSLKITGIKMFEYTAFPPGANFTSALGGLFVWNMMVALTAGAVNARILFKKTGTIWTGAFINSLLITLFAISNAVVVQGMF